MTLTIADQASQSDFANPNSPILDPRGLAHMLGISPATIPALRSRNPERLPPPYLSRPLRWRRETVVRWMERRERQEEERVEREFAAMTRAVRRA